MARVLFSAAIRQDRGGAAEADGRRLGSATPTNWVVAFRADGCRVEVGSEMKKKKINSNGSNS